MSLAKPLPQGVKFEHPVHVRSDGKTRGKDGQVVRRVVMEFLEGKPGQVTSTLRKAMTAAGFKASKVGKKTEGVRHVTFRKEGLEKKVHAWVKAAPLAKTEHADALGTVRIDWPE